MKTEKSLASRIREIRVHLYGENGIDAIARALKVPFQTWLNYERGVTMPAEVLLKFIVLTGVSPASLLNGDSAQPYRDVYSWDRAKMRHRASLN